MRARNLSTAACALVAAPAFAGITPDRLRCEYLDAPLGLGEAAPRLSWIVKSPDRGARQSAYRILVASDPALLRKGVGDLWDTGRVDSDLTSHIAYAGKPLDSGRRAWWKVQVWDGQGRPATSKPTFWEMGLLKRSDWRGRWIGLPVVGGDVDPKGARWIWFPEGNPAVEAPANVDRHFVRAIDLPADRRIESAVAGFAGDDSFTVFVNGTKVIDGKGWTAFATADIAKNLTVGRNVVSVVAHNESSRAGLIGVVRIKYGDGEVLQVPTGDDWGSSLDGKEWQPAKVLAPFGGLPYGRTVWGRSDVAAPFLRREFNVASPIVRARAYVTAKGLYRFFLDGKEVGKGVFTPGWTDYAKRIQYQTYDLTPYLKPGAHAVGLMLGDGWYCGFVGMFGSNRYGTRPMGLVQIEMERADGTVQRVVSDASWQSKTGPILMSDLLMGEDYDARKELPGWNRVGGGQGWDAVSTEPVGSVPLVAQQSPTVERLLEIKPKSLKETKPGVWVYDLGQNMVGWARLRVKGKAGDQVRIRFAEILDADGGIYTTNLRGARATENYTLRGGAAEVYEPSFTFHGFRYVELSGYPGKPPMSAVTGVVVGSNVPATGEFACSDPLVNQLQSNIVWGQRGNYLEVPTDCPQRDERLGWMGDAQIFARTAAFNGDVAAFMTKWTQDVVDAQTEQGGFPDFAPSVSASSTGSPAWGDAGVIVPWTMYRCYGDLRLLERRYDAMAKWVRYLAEANPNGVWTARSGANYGDWLNIGADMPRDVLGTAYFAHTTGLMAKIARLVGKPADAAEFDALQAKVKKAFNDQFVSPDGAIKGNTQTCYVLALWFELVPESLRDAVSKRLVDDILVARKGHLSTGFVGVGYLAPTLTSIGRDDVAYRLLLNETFPSWGYSIRQGATTIWERWDGWTEDKGFQDAGMNSFNHYSLGSVGEWLASRVAGIDLDPEVPGYRRFVVRPMPGGGMTWAKAKLESMVGPIESAWRIEDGTFILDVAVPANSAAVVELPPGRVESAEGATRRSDGRYDAVAGRTTFRVRLP